MLPMGCGIFRPTRPIHKLAPHIKVLVFPPMVIRPEAGVKWHSILPSVTIRGVEMEAEPLGRITNPTQPIQPSRQVDVEKALNVAVAMVPK